MRRAASRAAPADFCPTSGLVAGSASAVAPYVDGGEEEKPHHVDEVPVPGRELEAQMLLGREVAAIGAQQADGQEDRADDHMSAVEARRHEEGGAVDVAAEPESRVAVLVGLHEAEHEAEDDREPQAQI